MPSRIVPLFLAALVAAADLSAQPVLSVTQPAGPGSFDLSVTGAGGGAELFNLISLYPATPTGSGGFLGLNLVGSNLLLEQILEPLGTHPFHVLANGSGAYAFAFTVGVVGFSVPIDARTVEWHPTMGIIALSNVVNVTLDF